MLIFPLKKEWYEKIKSGEKTVEYRELKEYWNKRINNFIIENKANLHYYLKNGANWDFPKWCPPDSQYCKLRLGYTNKYLKALIYKIQIVDGKDTDLHIDEPVYAIHLADVRELIK